MFKFLPSFFKFPIFVCSFICLSLFNATPLHAQNSSSKGTDFWVAYTGHIDNVLSRMFLYLTAEEATTATIVIGGGASQRVNVAANTVTVVPIDGNRAYVGTSEVVEKKGIRVTAEKDIVVYSHIFRMARSAATIVLPTNTLGREYYTLNFEQSLPLLNDPNRFSEFTIVATEDNTTIQITPTQKTRNNRPANTPFKVTLNTGEVYQVQSTIDLTGSHITTNVPENITCKKVAVFSGSTWTAFGCVGASGGDNLYQQLYPLSSWGQNFVTAPLYNRYFEVYRILIGEDNTTVRVNGSTSSVNGVTLRNPYRKGSVIEFQSTGGNIINADKGISVAQYQVAQTCDPRNGPDINNPTNPGDPDMVILNPVEQTVTNTTLYSALQDQTNPPTRITEHYINVVMKTDEVGSFRIDGKRPTGSFVPIPNSDYSFLQENVTVSSQSQPTHNLVADAGFNAVAYGFGPVESYAYSAGANVIDLTKRIVPNTNTGVESGCAGVALNFTGNFPYRPIKIMWDFGDGTPIYEETDLNKIEQISENAFAIKSPDHVYPTAGKYKMKLFVTRSNNIDCDSQDEITYDFTVNPNPVAAFTFTTPCYLDPTIFTDTSEPKTGNALKSWSWNFGDPASGARNTATVKNPQHIFSAPGEYRVKLTITNNGGCTDTTSQKIIIYPKPKAIFNLASVCEDAVATFTEASTIPEGDIVGWQWNFGDGNTSADQNPTHTYQQAGRYRVRLTVTSNQTCTDTLSKVISIFPKPKVAFTLPEICVNDVATFTNTSSVPGGGNMTYQWDFGDGGTSTDQNPTHKYSAAGLYKVKLVVTSANGCQESLTSDFSINSATPKPDFTSQNYCQKDGVKFTDTSTIPFGKILRWQWDFGDGATSSEQNPTHVYARPGAYTVKLAVATGISCQEVISKNITIFASPTAAFTTTNICVGEAVVLTEASTNAGGSITAYTWDFGDGNTATGRQPNYVYRTPGTYNIKLTVAGANNCSDQITRQIVVSPKPVAAFNTSNLCEKDAIAFTDASTVSSGSINTWRWEFGDGATASQQNPSHSYNTAGTYTVKLTVITAAGCQEVISKTLTIAVKPQAVAGPDQVNLCGVTSTTLAATVPQVGTGRWSIVSGTGGNINNAGQTNTTFSGRLDELYTLRWTVSNAPCADVTDEVQVKFNSIPTVAAGPDVEIIEGQPYTMKGTGQGNLLWSPATGLANATAGNAVVTPLETTVYRLTATTDAGCTSFDVMKITVLPKLKVPNAFSPNDDGTNDTWVIGGIEEYQRATIQVFDRWGSQVYEGSYNKPWDGMRNGKSLPMATYYYIINPNNGHKPVVGNVSIVK
ncbi:MAG: PKD domain-containing protein [Adhaeribacter sp.]